MRGWHSGSTPGSPARRRRAYSTKPTSGCGPTAPPACWSNPPIRIGKAALHELLLRWLARLEPGGTAHLVVHKHLGSDSLARWMADHDYEVVRRGSHQGYRLLDVRPSTGAEAGAQS